ncbi:MAG: molybdopterin-dependent oxidoreductase [Spirochaetales bacterium]|nr:molybdopterin-dependent oxidoreductase [Spirochaetales bacterium]
MVKKSICWFCKGRCGVKIHLSDDEMDRIEIDRDYPFFAGSFGAGCKGLRLTHAKEWFYHKSRLDYPMKRTGRRGENRWTKIPWDQALDEIAARLDELKNRAGAESVATCKGDDWTHSEYETRFLNLFGSPNIFGVSPICWGPRALVSEAVFGWHPIYSVRKNTKCIIMLGVNIDAGRPALVNATKEAVKNGAKIITLDPRRSATAERSDIWLQLKPGTDAAVLLAMINHIISRNLYDREFVNRWCHGFDKLSVRAAEYSLADAERISGVPAGLIAMAAEQYATNNPGVIFEGMGVEQQTNSAQIIHARCILAAITGNIDVEGGEELDGPHPDYISDRTVEMLDELPEFQKRKQIGYDRFLLHSWPGQELLSRDIGRCYKERGGSHWYLGQSNLALCLEAITSSKPYPIEVLIVSATNPMVSYPDTQLVYRALKSVNLLVVMDINWTPTAQLADYVLPATSWLERPMLYSESGFGKVLEIVDSVVPGVTDSYDRKNDFDLWRGLGVRLGQKEHWPWETVKESYSERLKGKGRTWEEMVEFRHVEDVVPGFKKYEKTGFGTSTGKVELYSTVFERLGYDPLPFYQPHPFSEERASSTVEEYPFVMINGARVREYMLSTWRNVDSVRKVYPFPLVQIHPEAAQRLGIVEGEWVWIENEKGKIRQKARFFNGIQPDVIHCDQQWWYPELPGEEPWLHGVWMSNVNVLLDLSPENCNEIIGSWPQRIARVKIYK